MVGRGVHSGYVGPVGVVEGYCKMHDYDHYNLASVPPVIAVQTRCSWWLRES